MVGGWATIFKFKDGGRLAIEQGKWVGAAHGKKKKKGRKGSHNLAINRGVLLLNFLSKFQRRNQNFGENWEIKIFLSKYSLNMGIMRLLC